MDDRCTNCGAPDESSAAACAYCGARRSGRASAQPAGGPEQELIETFVRSLRQELKDHFPPGVVVSILGFCASPVAGWFGARALLPEAGWLTCVGVTIALVFAALMLVGALVGRAERRFYESTLRPKLQELMARRSIPPETLLRYAKGALPAEDALLKLMGDLLQP